MNNEELELSLRTEFENYLQGVLNEMKQEAREFQSRIEAEFEKHRSQINEAFAAFSARIDSENSFDEAFLATVAEHLRLARDEGAKITATAFAEAEKLERETASAASFEKLRDAIDAISSKDSQSSILKELLDRCAEFAPRGAFFIVKSEHLVGWKVFGAAEEAEDAVREVHIPVAADSVLGEAIRSKATIDSAAGAHHGDAAFLEPLGFGRPDRMYAIPLVARGKGVAVLYADYGEDGAFLNREALETLVRVAGMTVELIASESAGQQAAQYQPAADRPATQAAEPSSYQQIEAERPAVETATQFERFEPAGEVRTVYEEPAPVSHVEETSFERPSTPFEAVAAEESPFPSQPGPAFGEHPFESNAASSHDASHVSEAGVPRVGTPEPAPNEGAIVYGEPAPSEPAAISSPFEAPADAYVPVPPPQPEPPAVPEPAPVFQPVPEQAAETTPAFAPAAPVQPRSRLSDRPVDLPIDVPEEERRLHNDARRFARLLVSEIRLYNEKKVLEGKESGDLYERLKEAIDRSREMYDKRVQPPVAAKFDYFHYELVNSLADGDQSRLGSTYPGAKV